MILAEGIRWELKSPLTVMKLEVVVPSVILPSTTVFELRVVVPTTFRVPLIV